MQRGVQGGGVQRVQTCTSSSKTNAVCSPHGVPIAPYEMCGE